MKRSDLSFLLLYEFLIETFDQNVYEIKLYKKMKLSILLLIFFLSTNLLAQEFNQSQNKPIVSLSGFVDAYYVYDFNQPDVGPRQNFLFNYNRHNEFNINLGLIKLNVLHAKYRANIALHAGTYANDNYAAEPGLLKNIFEANVGIALNGKNNLWLDAGVFPSNLGFESAISIENMTLTRSLVAESSPYFLSGAKITYTLNEQWELVGLISNGWQRIQRVEDSSLPSFGTQISFRPDESLTLNWSTFIGTDDPDSTRRMRYFNNFYGIFQLTEKINLIAGFDYGIQQESNNLIIYDKWLAPVVIAQYSINKNWNTAVRAEYYQDQAEVIISTATADGFNTTGFSWNIDYMPTPNVACRLETRWLKSNDKIYTVDNNSFTDNNLIIAGSIAVQFSEMFRN